MLRDPLLACEGNRGRYTVTVSPPAGRRPVNPRARNCPGTAIPGPVRGSASGSGLVTVLSRPNRSGHRGSSVVAPLGLASLPGARGT
jgi:hypothetical protein